MLGCIHGDAEDTRGASGADQEASQLGEAEDIRPGTGKIPDEFWTMPRPKDPEGLMLKALLEDCREGR